MFTQAKKQSPAQQPAVVHHAPQPANSAQPAAWTRALDRLPLQASLTINQPGDMYEQEAEQTAAQVMRMPDPATSPVRRCACGGSADETGMCTTCRVQQPRLQRQSTSGSGMPAPSTVHETLRTPGQALDPAVRTFMEPRFGQDFSGVRIHTDPQAAQSAQDIRAQAYTLGQHIVFGAGRYVPGTDSGKQLLAHELAHVVQQAGTNASTVRRVPERDGIPDRYSFSSNCGWIDWSHADPSLVNTLLTRVRDASNALQSAGANPAAGTGNLTTPTMTSAVPRVGLVLSSANLSVRLLRPLSADEVFSVALSLFKKLSIVFETQQEWTDLVGSSSFAQEDLPSNLIAFYRAARGYSRAAIATFCGEVSADAARAEFDRDHNFAKNRSFTPVGISGAWPPELSTIDDQQASALYEIQTMSVVQGTSGFQFCPIYRIEGRIGETDLFILSYGGVRFTAADNVRVVPTYRFRPGTHGAYGHTTFVEVEPYAQADYAAFRRHNISWPAYIPRNVLVCLSSHGNAVP